MIYLIIDTHECVQCVMLRNLMDQEQRQTFEEAVKTLKERVDPGSKVLAGQDF